VIMPNNEDSKKPGQTGRIVPHNKSGMDAEAREYLMEIQADEDAARRDWSDDGECVDRESGRDPFDDLPEMDVIMNNIYDL
jgi:hypothetical protein